MAEYLYHGTAIPNIKILNAVSSFHGGGEQKIVYLTDNRAYALLYIWDSVKNLKTGKHVTAWIKDGIVYYEEQFPEQLKTFYDGVSGYLYRVEKNSSFCPVQNREAMWYSTENATVEGAEYIENVYDELLKYQKAGKLKIIHFEEVEKSRIDALYSRMADSVSERRLTETPNDPDALFYQKYFPRVWETAKAKSE
ncbi:MAG: hypothetical protein II987_05855 [Clostridia bacterium]|nr:hypothetical protein [Clostridia bacterium]